MEMDDAAEMADDESANQMLFSNQLMKRQKPIDRDFSQFVTNTMMKGQSDETINRCCIVAVVVVVAVVVFVITK